MNEQDEPQLFLHAFLGYKWLNIYRSKGNGSFFLGSPYAPTLWPKREELTALCRGKELCQEFPKREIRRCSMTVSYGPEEGAQALDYKWGDVETIPAKYEQVPSQEGHCGIYAYKTLELAKAHGGSNPFIGSVLARVKLWGDIVPAEGSWRAQYAYPDSLHQAFCLICKKLVPLAKTHLVRRGVPGVRLPGFTKYGIRCFRCAGGGYKGWHEQIAADYGLESCL